MKFEVLKRTHTKRYILIALLVVALISSLILNFTQAKYRVTESIPLIQGTINFSPSDLNLMAVYLNKNGETISSDKVPHVGYTLNEEQTLCEVNNVKDENIEISYENGLLNFNGLGNKGTKCTAYFDLIPDNQAPTVSIETLSSNDTSVTVTVNASDNIGIYYYYFKLDNGEEIRSEEASYTFDGLVKDSVHTVTVRVVDAAENEASDSDEVTVGFIPPKDVILASSNAPTGQTTDWTNDGQGVTYYYTGNPNNWVQFAGFWWRIIRINGDGTIRMIYQGTSANATGDGTQIGESTFNHTGNKTYVGLVYNTSSQHGYGTNSTIMTMLNNWYNDNIENDDKNLHYEQYIDTGAGFCSDRNMANGYNWSSNTVYYAAYDRRNGPASLQCNSEDILSQDNGKLPNPIGLVTSDEVVLTGITYSNSNGSYLHTGQTYWTMSPSYFNSSGAAYPYVFMVGYYGTLLGDHPLYYTNGVRPVINLRSDVKLTGSGTTSDPFKIVGA